jgi:hypothetical protein
MASTLDEQALRDLLAKQEILEVIHRRARAADRRDVELARTCYHDDAVEDHGGFVGPVDEYLRWSPISGDDRRKAMWHLVSNTLIEVDGDEATAESYVLAVELVDDEGRKRDMSVGGRYLDRFACRDGRWAIVYRQLVLDWSRVEEATPRYWDEMGLDLDRLPFGSAGGEDPVYRLSELGRNI